MLLGLLRPAVAGADLFSGYCELDYNRLSAKTSDVTGNDTMTKSDGFTQKYSLMLNKNIFPLLTLRAGYLFESDQSWLTTNDRDSRSRITTSLPSVDLTLGTPLLNGGIGYFRREESISGAGVPASSLFSEDYHGTFSWRPEGLPALSLNVERSNIFDDRRVSQDSTNDRATIGVTYQLKGVDLKYTGSYNDHSDRLQDLEVVQTTHAARATYGGQFLDERVSLYSSYNVSDQTTITTGKGAGFVDFQLTPFAGLFALNATPDLGGLDPLPALIDNDVRTGSGVNLGTTTQPVPLLRNLGIDLLSPTRVNRLLVWLDRRPDPKIVPLLSWDVYTSADNLLWTRATAVPLTGLGLDPVENRVELKFAPVTARYIKVVVAPLKQEDVQLLNIPGLTFPLDMFVTEVQAFEEKPAAEVQGKTGVIANILNLDLKVRLLDTPSLYYDSSFYLASVAPHGFLKWTLANALLADQRFSDLVSASARVAREDSEEPQGHRSAYVYSATLRVTPLQTLSHTLAYSGRIDSFQGKTSDTNALYLNNTAELYRGVNVSLNGGASAATNQTGEQIRTYSLIGSLNLAPRSNLSLNLNYNLSQTDLSGGDAGRSSATTRRGDMGVAYRPFPTLYLVASLGMLEQTLRKNDLVQNYGVNWSPFPDGTLQFNVGYQENIRTIGAERSRLFSPSLTWKVTNRATLDLAFPLLRTSSTFGRSSSETFSAMLRMSF